MARTVTTTFKGEDQITPVTNKIADSFSKLSNNVKTSSSNAGGASGIFGKLGSALGGIATVAGGIVAANIFGKISDGLSGFVSTGLSAVSASQQLDTSLNALFASNLMYERSTEQVTTAVSKSASELAAQQGKIDDLRLSIPLLTAQVQEQKQRVWEMTNQWGEQGLATETARAKLAKMEGNLSQTTAELAKLESGSVEYATTSKTTYKQVLDMAEAQGMARSETQKLRKEIDKIAVISPFEAEQVEQVAKFAVTAGMGADQAADFTAAFLDLGAAVGIGSQDLAFAADQLLQVQKVGKLTTIDLRQLRRLGIDLEKIIGTQMGMSIEEFNKKAENSPEIFDDLFKAVQTFSENTFAGSAAAFSESVDGIKSQASDLFKIGARDLFAPLVEFATPAALEVMSRLSDIFLGGNMETVGQGLVDIFKGIGDIFSGEGGSGIDKVLEGLVKLGLQGENLNTVYQALKNVVGTVTNLVEVVSSGSFYDILAAMGFSGSNITAIYEIKGALDGIWTSITENLLPSSDEMGSLWNDKLLPAIQAVGEWIGANLLPFLADLAKVFEDFVAALMPELAAMWVELKNEFASAKPALDELWASFGKLAEAFGFDTEEGSALDVVIGALKLTLDLMLATVQGLQPAISVLGEVISYVAGVTSGFLDDVTSLVTAFQGLTDTSTSLGERLLNLGSAFAGFAIPDELIPGSPTPFEMGLRGIAGVVSGELPSAFTSFFTLITSMTQTFIETLLMPFNALLIEMYDMHIPTMQAIWEAAMILMTSTMQQLINVTNVFAALLQTIISILNQMVEAFKAMASAAKKAAEEMMDGFEDAAKSLEEKLWPAIKESIKLLERLEHQANAAQNAVSQITGSEETLGGARASGGPVIGGNTYLVGEAGPELFTPTRQGYINANDSGGGGGSTVIQYILNVTTVSQSEDIIADFNTMRALHSPAGG